MSVESQYPDMLSITSEEGVEEAMEPTLLDEDALAKEDTEKDCVTFEDEVEEVIGSAQKADDDDMVKEDTERDCVDFDDTEKDCVAFEDTERDCVTFADDDEEEETQRRDKDGDTDDETFLVVPSGKRYKTKSYHRRWYILFLFSMSSLVWNAVWSTWGPIAQSAKHVYDWTDEEIAMSTWLGNAPFLITMFPIAYLMDVKGLRIAMLLCCGLTFIGSAVRCIPVEDKTISTWLIMSGQLINGIAGTVPVAGPGLVSGLWFPQHQRFTATAISTVAGNLGVSCSFIVGPLLVPEPWGLAEFFPNVDEMKAGILNVLYLQCGATGILFLLTLIYFPSKPPKPPSTSASTAREDYGPGLRMLLQNKQFWITAVAYSVPAGVYEVWQVLLDVNLYPRVSQATAGWMDLYSTLGGIVAGLLVSRFADMFSRQTKLFLLAFYLCAAVSVLWFTFLVDGTLVFSTASVHLSNVMCGVFLDGGAPLFFELAIKVAHPVGEGVTSGVLQLLTSGAGMAFLSVLQVDSMGKAWMNWTFVGCIVMAVPMLYFIDTEYGRADNDVSESDDSEVVGVSSRSIVTCQTQGESQGESQALLLSTKAAMRYAHNIVITKKRKLL